MNEQRSTSSVGVLLGKRQRGTHTRARTHLHSHKACSKQSFTPSLKQKNNKVIFLMSRWGSIALLRLHSFSTTTGLHKYKRQLCSLRFHPRCSFFSIKSQSVKLQWTSLSHFKLCCCSLRKPLPFKIMGDAM